ncbi:hypothetical protein ACSS6N_15335 [Peribacillus frigoritolerans]|uniref:hypothetical protein n=1 Tax=Peribacillus frigoritolerans TaxID=450367 RepID=UPI003F864409
MNFLFKSIHHYQLASPNTEDQSRKFFTGSNRDRSRFMSERRIISFRQEKRIQHLKLKNSTNLNNI